MAVNFLSAGDWTGGSLDSEFGSFGSDTGFGVFSSDPLSGGIPDSQGAFNPAFNGETKNPSFLASTDFLRRSLPGVARRARAGDVQSAYGYNMMYQDLQNRKSAYDRAYSAGVNDRNAASIMEHVFASVTASDFGPGTDQQFRERYAGYLGKQAVRRGVNASGLFSSESRLSSIAESAYLTALESGSSVSERARGVRDAAKGNKGVLANMSLALKEALADWEESTGALRSDMMRGDILRNAAQIYAQCQSNTGLNRLEGDYRAIIEAAAERAGAVAGTVGQNRFDSYDSAVRALPSFVTMTGSADSDEANGYGAQTRNGFVSAIRDAYASYYGRNAAEGGDARIGTEGSDLQLRRDLETGIRTKGAPWLVQRDPDGKVTGKLVDEILRQAGTDGVLNLDKAFRSVWVEPDPELLGYRDGMRKAAFTPAISTAMQSYASGLVERAIGERRRFAQLFSPSVTGAYTYSVPAKRGTMFDRDGVDKVVGDEIGQLVRNPEIAAYLDGHKELADAIRAVSSEYILNANNVADPVFAGSGNRAEYANGLYDRIGALFMAQELVDRKIADRLVLPGRTGEDSAVRGRGDADRRSTYSGLHEVLKSYVDTIEKTTGGDTSRIEDVAAVNNYLFAKSALKGLDAQLGSTDGATPTAVGNRENTFRTASGSGFEAAIASANAATERIVADRLAAAGMLRSDSGLTGDQLQVWQDLAAQSFSSYTNPRMANLAREKVSSVLGQYNLTAGQRKYFESAYLPMVFRAMQQTSSKLQRYGSVPMSDGIMDTEVDRLISAGDMFAAARTLADANTARDLAKQEAMRQQAAVIQSRLAQAKENGEVYSPQ